MSELPPQTRLPPDDDAAETSESDHPHEPATSAGHNPDDEGFSTAERLLGTAAVYQAPFLSSLAASAMLHDETNPVRRRQLMQFRSAALVWMAVGALVVIIGLVVVASVWSKASGGGACKGGPEPWNAAGAQYWSSDNVHWTATVPCFAGGQTDVPVPAGAFP